MIVGITLFAAITGTITSSILGSQEATEQTEGDVPARLRALVGLQREGIVTDAEFEAKKAELLRHL